MTLMITESIPPEMRRFLFGSNIQKNVKLVHYRHQYRNKICVLPCCAALDVGNIYNLYLRWTVIYDVLRPRNEKPIYEIVSL